MLLVLRCPAQKPEILMLPLNKRRPSLLEMFIDSCKNVHKILVETYTEPCKFMTAECFSLD